MNAENSDRFKVRPHKLIEEKTTEGLCLFVGFFFNAREVWLEAYFGKGSLCAAPTVIVFPRHLIFVIYMLLKSYTVDLHLTFKI